MHQNRATLSQIWPYLTVQLNHLLKHFIPSQHTDSALTPVQHVQLYHKMSFLCNVTRHSDVIRREIREHSLVEFK